MPASLADPRVGLRIDHLVAGYAEQAEAQAVIALRQIALVARPLLAFEVRVDLLLRRLPVAGLAQVLLDLLVDRRIHEERQDHRRRAVDRHRDRGRRRAQIEARIELLHVVDGRDRNAGVADLAVDVRALVRVLAVQRDRIERRRQARRGLALRQVVKTPVGALRRALARKHARRVLAQAPIRIDAAGVRVAAGQVLLLQERQQLAPVRESGAAIFGIFWWLRLSR